MAAGRPFGSITRDKPFRDALRMEIEAAGENRKKLRQIARALLDNASSGDNVAIKEVADRLDGKPTEYHEMNVRRPREVADDELTDIATGSSEGTAVSPIDPPVTH